MQEEEAPLQIAPGTRRGRPHGAGHMGTSRRPHQEPARPLVFRVRPVDSERKRRLCVHSPAREL